MSKEGVKHDQGKADLSLLSYDALSEIARAFEFGAKKYGRYNYLGGMEWTRIGGALLRHTYAWLWGEDHDDESGIHHLGHAGACVIMLLDYVLKKLGTDNRYKKPDIKNIITDDLFDEKLTKSSVVKIGELLVCIDTNEFNIDRGLHINNIYTVKSVNEYGLIQVKEMSPNIDIYKRRFKRKLK